MVAVRWLSTVHVDALVPVMTTRTAQVVLNALLMDVIGAATFQVVALVTEGTVVCTDQVVARVAGGTADSGPATFHVDALEEIAWKRRDQVVERDAEAVAAVNHVVCRVPVMAKRVLQVVALDWVMVKTVFHVVARDWLTEVPVVHVVALVCAATARVFHVVNRVV